jgi:hypothetical protein
MARGSSSSSELPRTSSTRPTKDSDHGHLHTLTGQGVAHANATGEVGAVEGPLQRRHGQSDAKRPAESDTLRFVRRSEAVVPRFESESRHSPR